MSVYYNEHDPKAAAWLRELIRDGLIPDGFVDERDIQLVAPGDIAGYTQHHFFAGIGGWPEALRIAGWPESKPLWTASCPCQSFSLSGKQKGQEDPRHLWPVFFRLVREHGPEWIFGEQVENAIGHGWLDGIQADLEGEGYAVGHCVLGAHSAGAPHIRQRLYWMAHATIQRWDRSTGMQGTDGGASLAGWATPNAPRKNDSDHSAFRWNPNKKQDDPVLQILGRTAILSSVPMEKRGALNPAFSLWLMGYRAEWASCGVRAMQSLPKPRRTSSAPA